MKKVLYPILFLFLKFFYRKFKNNEYFKSPLLAYVFYQRILGINRRAYWPVHWTSQVKSPEKIQPGTKAPGFSMGCYIDGRNGIVIEENVWIGPKVSIISMHHDIQDYEKYIGNKPIIIRKNSLLATNCTILAGVELGEHTVVAPGAVVTRSFIEGNQVLAGNPAMVTKRLEPYKG